MGAQETNLPVHLTARHLSRILSNWRTHPKWAKILQLARASDLKIARIIKLQMVVDYASAFHHDNIFAVLDTLHAASGCPRVGDHPGYDAQRYHECLDDVVEALRYRVATPVRDFLVLGDVTWMKHCSAADTKLFDELVAAVMREDVTAMKALKRRLRYENKLRAGWCGLNLQHNALTRIQANALRLYYEMGMSSEVYHLDVANSDGLLGRFLHDGGEYRYSTVNATQPKIISDSITVRVEDVGVLYLHGGSVSVVGVRAPKTEHYCGALQRMTEKSGGKYVYYDHRFQNAAKWPPVSPYTFPVELEELFILDTNFLAVLARTQSAWITKKPKAHKPRPLALCARYGRQTLTPDPHNLEIAETAKSETVAYALDFLLGLGSMLR